LETFQMGLLKKRRALIAVVAATAVIALTAVMNQSSSPTLPDKSQAVFIAAEIHTRNTPPPTAGGVQVSNRNAAIHQRQIVVLTAINAHRAAEQRLAAATAVQRVRLTELVRVTEVQRVRVLGLRAEAAKHQAAQQVTARQQAAPAAAQATARPKPAPLPPRPLYTAPASPSRPVYAPPSGGARGCIAKWESGGDYFAHNSSSSASGAYQFLDTTWFGVTGLSGEARAYPPAVQDAAFDKLWAGGAGAGQWVTAYHCT
jgi:Transglycosylase-like domain